MQLTVSLTVELDATEGINAVERQVLAAGRRLMSQLVQQAVRAYEEQVQACPRCGSGRLASQGTRGRVLLTRFGRVELRVQRQECRACGQRFRPAEGCLREVAGSNVTAALAQACGVRPGHPGRMRRPLACSTTCAGPR